MAAVAITTTPQDITGDFDVQVRGNPDDPRKSVILQKSLEPVPPTTPLAKCLEEMSTFLSRTLDQ